MTENGQAFTVSLDVGSYHAIQLRTHLASQLTAASASGAGYTYTVTFDEVASKYSFGVDSPLGVNSFAFSTSKTAYKLLGFEKASTNALLVGSGLTSTKAVSMLFSDALYLHCDLLNTNVDKRPGDQTSFHLSTAFAKIPINTSPFNNIIFTTSTTTICST